MGATTERSPVRVLYIVGAGRSGSTVLDTILGAHPDVESVGELTNLVKNGLERGEFCACGERGPECSFWKAVVDRWLAAVGSDDPSRYRALQLRFERLRVLPRLGRGNGSPELAEYRRWTVELYRAIQEVSGAAWIVDSSKGVSRARALVGSPEIDLRLVHLVRDGRGVAWSLKKSFQPDPEKGLQKAIRPRPAWRTALFWAITNAAAGWVRREVGEGGLRLRYEDLAADSGAALERIGALAGLDYSAIAAQVAAGEALPVGHTIAGNRLRMAGAVRFRPDVEWTRRLGTGDRMAFWLLAGWMLAAYGYRARG